MRHKKSFVLDEERRREEEERKAESQVRLPGKGTWKEFEERKRGGRFAVV